MAESSFRREERLKRKKQIDQLFASGRSFFSYPFKVIWLTTEQTHAYPAQVLISVSRRTIRKAIQRNRIKRLVREAYRQQKSMLYTYLGEENQHLLLGIIYTGHEMLTFEQAQEKIIRVLSRLLKEIRHNP